MYDFAVWVPINSKSGFGHFYRMLGLYNKLSANKQKITYFTNEKFIKLADVNIKHLYTNDIKLIIEYLKKHLIKTLIIDNYWVTKEQINLLKNNFKIAYFDAKFANYAVDIIINYNPYAITKYSKKNNDTKYFLGLKYMIFRQEILQAKKLNITKNKEKTIFISIGGADIKGITYKILPYLAKNNAYKIVLGEGCSNKYYEKVLAKLKQLKLNYNLYKQPENYFSILNSCDYAISSCSTTVYELIYFNKPFVCVNTANNQDVLTKYLNLGAITTLDENNINKLSDIMKYAKFNLPKNITIGLNKGLDLVSHLEKITK